MQVRTTYAQCLVSLAATAYRFLTRAHYMDQVGCISHTALCCCWLAMTTPSLDLLS